MTTEAVAQGVAEPVGVTQRLARSRSWSAGLDGAMLFGATAAEFALALAGAMSTVPLGVIVVLHGFVVGALVWRIGRASRGGEDTARLLLATILTAVAGPIGAIAGLIGMLVLPGAGTVTPFLAAWYERIAQSTRPDPVKTLCDSVAIGRGLDLSGPAPPAFATIIRDGTLSEKQAALGLVARAYHPAYIRALSRALVSPEPVIRVQAAAVAARLRDGIATALEDAMGRARGTAGAVEALGLIEEIDAAIGSGLVDQTLAARGAQVSRRLKTQMLSSLSSVECGVFAAWLARQTGPDSLIVGAHLLGVLEALLAEAKLWSHLRAAGRASRVARRGDFVIRRRHDGPGRQGQPI